MNDRLRWIVIVAILSSPATGAENEASTLPDFPPRLRRPIALVLSNDERFAYTANRCGSVSIVDIEGNTTIAEIDVGTKLSDLKAMGPHHLLATDEAAHEVLLLDTRQQQVQVVARLPVSPYPVSLSVDSQRGAAYVASLWSRRLTRIRLPAVPEKSQNADSADDGQQPPLEVIDILDVDIAPRAQVLTPDGQHLLVADSFGGQLAIIEVDTFRVTNVRKIPGHNIRGLACSPNSQMLAVADQMLNDLARTERNDVHWGLLMSNDLRWLRLSTLLSDEDLYVGAHMHPLGEASNATADPSALAFAPNGVAVVALGGVHEVAIGKEHDFSFYRIPVGKRPTAIATSNDSRWAFVANTFGDSITRIDLSKRAATGEIKLGPQRELTLIERGETLFYDGSLSHDNWMSCHSCHTDGHSNGGLNDNFSDGSFGQSKRVLSLLGVAETLPLAWNGSVNDLATQLQNSTQHTMQNDEGLSESQLTALIAYLETLQPPPSVDQLRGTLNSEAVVRGSERFRDLGCVDCHQPPLYTSDATYDVGLEEGPDDREFNPPSLRGLSQRGPYFHDNRAATLEDVFQVHRHQLDQPLADSELRDLIAFLRSR